MDRYQIIFNELRVIHINIDKLIQIIYEILIIIFVCNTIFSLKTAKSLLIILYNSYIIIILN